MTVDLLEADEEAAELVRSRKTWFSVDEYQDTNPLAERLLELWLGRSRDVAVVGDPDQTIYTFSGATPEFLLGFAQRHEGARTITLVDNYRSTPQVLALANRIVGPGTRGALRPTRPAGPDPSIRHYPDAAAELAGIVTGIRRLLGEGVVPAEIAILVRTNAQLPDIEEALTRAAIPFQVRGQRFFDRREVREARRLLARSRPEATGAALVDAVATMLTDRLGLGAVDEVAGEEGRAQQASLELLFDIIGDLASADPSLSIDRVIAELDARAAEEAAGSVSGVNLLTYHRAKGLEWDAVFLPSLIEGVLPIRHAKDEAAIAEERRLLYVGITRARTHLALSTDAGRRPSRFLEALASRPVPGQRQGQNAKPAHRRKPGPGRAATPGPGGVVPVPPQAGSPPSEDSPLLRALWDWRRERAGRDGVPAYLVAENATLQQIDREQPRSRGALLRVRGIGDKKAERYGAEILAIVEREGRATGSE